MRPEYQAGQKLYVRGTERYLGTVVACGPRRLIARESSGREWVVLLPLHMSLEMHPW